MTVHKLVLDAFIGVSFIQPISINVRYRGIVRQIYVGFGEIRIPFFTGNVDVKKLEKEHECMIKRTGNGWIIIPNVVKEIIEKDGVLCSVSEKHRKALEEWINAHGASVIKSLLEL